MRGARRRKISVINTPCTDNPTNYILTTYLKRQQLLSYVFYCYTQGLSQYRSEMRVTQIYMFLI